MSIVHFTELSPMDVLDLVMFWNSGKVCVDFCTDKAGAIKIKSVGLILFSVDRGFITEQGKVFEYVDKKSFEEYQVEMLNNGACAYALDFLETELYYMELYSIVGEDSFFSERIEKLRNLINLICSKVNE